MRHPAIMTHPSAPHCIPGIPSIPQHPTASPASHCIPIKKLLHHSVLPNIIQYRAVSSSITQHHPLAVSITLYHSASPCITQHHPVALNITQYHSASSIHAASPCITQHHLVSLSIILHHSASSCITQHHFVSLSITLYHSKSLCITQHPSASSSITQHHPASPSMRSVVTRFSSPICLGYWPVGLTYRAPPISPAPKPFSTPPTPAHLTLKPTAKIMFAVVSTCRW